MRKNCRFGASQELIEFSFLIRLNSMILSCKFCIKHGDTTCQTKFLILIIPGSQPDCKGWSGFSSAAPCSLEAVSWQVQYDDFQLLKSTSLAIIVHGLLSFIKMACKWFVREICIIDCTSCAFPNSFISHKCFLKVKN